MRKPKNCSALDSTRNCTRDCQEAKAHRRGFWHRVDAATAGKSCEEIDERLNVCIRDGAGIVEVADLAAIAETPPPVATSTEMG